MFLASFKGTLKKICYCNRKQNLKTQSVSLPTKLTSSNTDEIDGLSAISPEDEELELPLLPITYFECQRGMRKWINKVKGFSHNSKGKLQQWTKATQICLAEVQLQQDFYHAANPKSVRKKYTVKQNPVG